MDGNGLEAEPASPRSAPVVLTSCLEELLKFILSAYFPLGLSPDYCERLLRDDSFAAAPSQNSSVNPTQREAGGVPSYPLYKHLARALEGCISSGSFFRERKSVKGLREDDSLEFKQRVWEGLIMEKGVELVNMLENVDFELHVQEPFFSQLKDGFKTVEGRCATGDYNRISVGAQLLFNGSLLVKVQDIRHYSSFSEMLEVELAAALPEILTVEEGVQVYRKFYTEEKELCNGVLAISVMKVASQPYIILGNLLSILGYEGIGSLLGMRHTTGTILDALPPPDPFFYHPS